MVVVVVMVMACLVLFILEMDAHLVHGVENQPERLDDVAKDDGFPFELFVFAEALSVDQLHLLEHRGLARLARPCRPAKKKCQRRALDPNGKAVGLQQSTEEGIPSSNSLTSLAIFFSSARMALSSSRDRATPLSSALLRSPKHMAAVLSKETLARGVFCPSRRNGDAISAPRRGESSREMDGDVKAAVKRYWAGCTMTATGPESEARWLFPASEKKTLRRSRDRSTMGYVIELPRGEWYCCEVGR